MSLLGQLRNISVSKINKYFSCGRRFQLEYIYEMRPPGGINLIRGSALHTAIEKDNEYYIKSQKRLSCDDLKRIGITTFQEKLEKDGVFIPKRDEANQKKIIQTAKEELYRALELYFSMEKPWQPVSVEERIEAQDDRYPLPLLGIADMIDETNCIWDWKTAKKKTDMYVGLQNMMYSKLYEMKWGVKPTFKYCIFILTKKKSYIDIQEIGIIKNYDMLDLYIETFLKAVQKEVYLPASRYDFLCSEAVCPFYLCCDYVK